jgi:two-component system, cell cycle sensor histidine kinase and response regulator CckA
MRLLNMSDATALEHDNETNAPVDGNRAGRAILVMDDEQVIRELCKGMLELLAYEATACSNGEEAIRLYKIAKEDGTPFMAVIMDLDIPGGMGGKEAAQHILAIDPDARLVVSSGSHNDAAMTDFKSYGFCSVMPKPYKIYDISDILTNLHKLSKVTLNPATPSFCKTRV